MTNHEDNIKAILIGATSGSHRFTITMQDGTNNYDVDAVTHLKLIEYFKEHNLNYSMTVNGEAA